MTPRRRAASTRRQDADSEGEEGKFFVWTLEEIERAARRRGRRRVASAYWASPTAANFEGRSILTCPGRRTRSRPSSVSTGERLERASRAVPRQALRRARAPRAARARRQGADRLERPDARGLRRGGARARATATTSRCAERNAEFLLAAHASRTAGCCAPGRTAGPSSRLPRGLRLPRRRPVALYEATLTQRWFEAARRSPT